MEYTTKTFTFPDGSTSKVHKPILTEEEYERRHAVLYKAAERFLKHCMQVEEQQKERNERIKNF